MLAPPSGCQIEGNKRVGIEQHPARTRDASYRGVDVVVLDGSVAVLRPVQNRVVAGGVVDERPTAAVTDAVADEHRAGRIHRQRRHRRRDTVCAARGSSQFLHP